MIKEHKELFETLLEQFKEDSKCCFFCKNEVFEELWVNDEFRRLLRKYTHGFMDVKYPEKKKFGELLRDYYIPLFPEFNNYNKIRIEFLNWLIPQL